MGNGHISTCLLNMTLPRRVKLTFHQVTHFGRTHAKKRAICYGRNDSRVRLSKKPSAGMASLATQLSMGKIQFPQAALSSIRLTSASSQSHLREICTYSSRRLVYNPTSLRIVGNYQPLTWHPK